MRKAVDAGLDSPPADLRYLTKPCQFDADGQSSSVVSFLSEVYESVAETLPDFRDDTMDVETTLEEGPEADSYAQLLIEKSGPEAPKLLEQKRETEKKDVKKNVRTMKKSVLVNPGRRADLGGAREEKWLPPGQMKDYWEMYKMRGAFGLQKPASFTTFWRALGFIASHPLFFYVLFCLFLFVFHFVCLFVCLFVLFCFVLFCFVLFCLFVLFCFVLFCFVCLFVCLLCFVVFCVASFKATASCRAAYVYPFFDALKS